MSFVNKKLYETFTTACSHREMKIHWNVGSLNVYFDNGNYIMLWTPLNKLPSRQEIKTEFDIRMSLSTLNDNMHDYHIECNAKESDRMMAFHLTGWKKANELYDNPTVDGWFELFDYAQDNDAIDIDYAHCMLIYD